MDTQTPTQHPTRQPHPQPPPGLMWGLGLIAIGVIFLLAEMEVLSLDNWWALFILIPAFSSFFAAYELFRRSGRFSITVRGSLMSGLIILATALMFLLKADWGEWWSIYVILGGLWILSNGIPEPGRHHPMGKTISTWMISIGGSAFLLGLGFLLKNLGIFDPSSLVRTWWAVPIMLPVLGGLIRIVQIYSEKQRLNLDALANLVAILTFLSVGIVALTASWTVLLPVLLIGAGVLLLASRLAWK